jgi:hypothetical protein
MSNDEIWFEEELFPSYGLDQLAIAMELEPTSETLQDLKDSIDANSHTIYDFEPEFEPSEQLPTIRSYEILERDSGEYIGRVTIDDTIYK